MKSRRNRLSGKSFAHSRNNAHTCAYVQHDSAADRTATWWVFVAVAMGLALLMLTGCSSYQLQGKVVEGPESMVLVVSRNDPRLNEQPVPGAILQMQIDPHSLGGRHLEPVRSDTYGNFSVPIEETGAGLLEYDIEIIGRSAGLEPAIGTVRIPGSSKRILVVLKPGDDIPTDRDNILHDTLERGRREGMLPR